MPKPNGGKLGVKSSSQGIIGLEEHYILQRYRLGSAANPASSASELRAAGITDDAAYFYRVGDSVRQLWTDFSSFPNYPMVLVSRIKADELTHNSPNQYNVEDLVSATTSAPSRAAKLSDEEINEINTTGKIRWQIVANGQMFYRISGDWVSNSATAVGVSNTCSYATNAYSGFATPSNTPNWVTSFGNHNGGCGGGQDDTSNWMVLSGIGNVSGTNYTGGYVGNSTYINNPPSQYVTSTSTGWYLPGYIFLEW